MTNANVKRVKLHARILATDDVLWELEIRTY